MLKFEIAELVYYSDIERCPYSMFSLEAKKWGEKDYLRLKITALERWYYMNKYLVITNHKVIIN